MRGPEGGKMGLSPPRVGTPFVDQIAQCGVGAFELTGGNLHALGGVVTVLR